jgi:hypothetical protein
MTRQRTAARSALEAAHAALPETELAPLLVALRWLAGAPHRLLHGEAARLFTGLSDDARTVLAIVAAALASGREDPARLSRWLEGYLDEVAARPREAALAAAA